MKYKILPLLTIVSLLMTAPYSFAKKPPTGDSLQQQIEALNTRINELEARQSTPVVKLFVGDILLGYRSLTRLEQFTSVYLYEPISGYFLTIQASTSNGTTELNIAKINNILYGTFDCTGQGMVSNRGAADSRNELIANGTDFYVTAGITTAPRPIVINSSKDEMTGICGFESSPGDNAGVSLVDPIAYPLPYSLPISIPAFSIRMEYAAP